MQNIKHLLTKSAGKSGLQNLKMIPDDMSIHWNIK